MDKLKILAKEKTNHKDHLTIFIIEGVERLYDDCTEADLELIKKSVCEIWRKYHNIEELNLGGRNS